MGVSWNISGLRRDGWALAIATKVLTRRSLRWRACYRHEKLFSRCWSPSISRILKSNVFTMEELNLEPFVLNIKNGLNFRDLGGYKTKSGQVIKSRKIIRSARLSELSDDDLQYLADYGLTTDVDFRSPEEQAAEPDRYPENTTYHFVPVFPTDETKSSEQADALQKRFSRDPHAGFENMVKTYADIVKMPSAQKAYRQFFDILLSHQENDGAVLFHCTAGKDRTGMGAVYLLSALGVDGHTIRQDYLATNDLIQPMVEKNLAAARKRGATDALLANIRDLGTVSGAFLDSALATIDAEYGNMHNYLKEALQLTDAEKRDLRELYLQ